ncbi:BTAD domain-containing putative transcriptional regulator [Actinoplanes sp. L3-i22]|uniref:ATP-binding protein n=1 Tax=Actinoplanes sp. L3-i22 TaxID=2836373 RepID=UPI001C76EEA7|nr:BTAD domain-containing putative transcriptional regulator [Actinoplanes sp. L3-i22]BCY07243.1 hypothetical protein L3i22_023310 [Actinoplanes sp. L3-i22]
MPVPAVPPTGGGQPYLQVLGPLRIWRDGAELDPGPRQQALLLALLLARAGMPAGTGELIDLIWGDDIPASALNIVQKHVGALRRMLEPALPARGTGSFLQLRGNSYLFVADPAVLDLAAFRTAVTAARSATAQRHDAAALDHYTAALGLWHGPTGNGIADRAGATAIFAAVDNEFYDACTAAAGIAVATGRAERVLPALRLAATMAPFHEPVHAALVAVLAAAGRQAEALSVFGAIRDRLADELGIDPGPALTDAHRRVLAQAPDPAGPAVAADRAPTAGATGLIGRIDELAVLRHTVQSALTGRTGIGIVEGEPGVGKTRLLEETAAEAARLGATVVWGSCLEGDGTPSMWPWEQALGTIVGGLPAPDRDRWLAGQLGSLLAPGGEAGRSLPGGSAQFQLFEQVVALVTEAAAHRPTLLILDDLQWADTTSLRLFSHLAGRLPQRAAIIGALRDRAPTIGSELSQALAAAGRLPGHRRFRLGPLAPGDVAALIRHESGDDPGEAVARAIHARTEGNPFFVLELSRLLSEAGTLGAGEVSAGAGVPATVRDVVRDRMAGLDDRARDLLHVAALIGRDVDLRLLSRAAGVYVADCLERLEPLHALGLLESSAEHPSSLRFAHDLVRESVTETTTRQRLVRLHLRVADALEQTHPDDESITERLAYHLWSAGHLAEPVRIADTLIRAGRRAAAKLAFESANRQLRSAAQVARAAGLTEQELSALTLFAVVIRRQAGYDTPTMDLLERGEQLAHALGRTAEAADFLFIRVAGALTAMAPDRGSVARRMHEHGLASTDPVARSYARQAWGLHQLDIGNVGASYRSFTETDPAGDIRPADTPLRRDGTIPGQGPPYQAMSIALYGEVDAALAVVDVWDKPAAPHAVSVWAFFTGMIAAMAGDAALARRVSDRWVAADLARLRAQIDHYIRQYGCWARALTGGDPAAEAAEAEQLLAADLVDPPQWGLPFQYALIAEMWLADGRADRAGYALDRAERAMATLGERFAEGLLLLVRARLLQTRGEPPAVVRAAAERARARSAAAEAHLLTRRAERFLAELDAGA